MTVSNDTPYVSYTGDGSTDAFSTGFTFMNPVDVEVIERVIATGAETVKTLTTEYQVSGGSGSAGTVTMTVAPASTVELHIRRAVPRTQLSDYVTADAFPAATFEQNLDALTRMVQELRRDLDKAVRFPKTEDGLSGILAAKPSRLGKILGFNATTGLPEMLDPSGITYAIGTWTPTVVGDTSAGTQTYSHQSGEYTRIGNLVRIRGRFTLATKSGTGNICIKGLPFTPYGAAGIGGQGIMVFSGSGVDLSSGYTQLVAGTRGTVNNGECIGLIEMGDNVGSQVMTMAQLSSTASVVFTGWYQIA